MKNLFLLAIMPPPDVSNIIRRIQEEFSEKYNSIAALKNKVHVTLIPPFWAETINLETLENKIDLWIRKQQPFEITLAGFGSFKRNHVIFINVDCNDELIAFQKSIEEIVNDIIPGKKLRTGLQYHPHFTIGYRDIPKPFFKEAEAEYLQKKFDAEFLLDKIYLWKHHGQGWEIIKEFQLGG